MGGLCFMIKGSMCCSVSGKGGLLIRVDHQAQALREQHVRPMKVGGRTMNGFVRVAPEGYRTDAALNKWVMRAVDFLAARPESAQRAQARGKRRRVSAMTSKR